MTYDHAYSDRDVREDPRLSNLAHAYIEQYTGSHEAILGKRRKVARGGTLTTAEVRSTLNWMRSDYVWADALFAPNAKVVIPDVGEASPAAAAVKEPPVSQPKPRFRKGSITMNARSRTRFVKNRSGLVFHLVNPTGRTRARWNLKQDGVRRLVELNVATRCGLSIHTSDRRILWSWPESREFILAHQDTGARTCLRCYRIEEESH